ncbi:MAG: alpha/beta hydrolase [Arachnia propionica]|uniref:alpha/beta hydrolase n=1 Tax=Arachnia propionica TaxID=1750 RepID=UPI002700956D|nr:alpha/beta hydrolase [Arachnia propionica]
MSTPAVVSVTSPDGHRIPTRQWLPVGEIEAVVVISHGLAEHGGRYHALAEALVATGAAVYAADHRGHGPWTPEPDLGFFADWQGWHRVVGDLGTVIATVRTTHPGPPVFLLGHSVGSLIARCHAASHSEELDGMILTGTVGDQGPAVRALLPLARLFAVLRGRTSRSRLLHQVVFGNHNRSFRPARTDVDWLSRDEEAVDAYIADPLCGFVSTVSLYVDLIAGNILANEAGTIAGIRRGLPILIASGAMDPLVPGVPRLAERLRRAGVVDVTLRLYPGARHELFHETNRDEVFSDVVGWVEQVRTRASR